jgi:hypothetical protein
MRIFHNLASWIAYRYYLLYEFKVRAAAHVPRNSFSKQAVYRLVCNPHFIRLAFPHTSSDAADPCLLSACTVRCKIRPLSLT